MSDDLVIRRFVDERSVDYPVDCTVFNRRGCKIISVRDEVLIPMDSRAARRCFLTGAALNFALDGASCSDARN